MNRRRGRFANPYPGWMTLPSALMISVFFLLPLFLGVGLAFTNWGFYSSGAPTFIGFANFQQVLADPEFATVLRNTVLFTVVILVLRNVFALLLALGLNMSLRITAFLRTVFFLPSMLSYAVVGIMFVFLLRLDGFVNSLLAGIAGGEVQIPWLDSTALSLYSVMLLDLWVWSGFHAMLILAGLQTIPDEYYEAAEIDGAGSLKRFWHITLPLLTPTLRMSLVLTMIGAFRVFEQALVLTGGGPGNSSMTLGLYIYRLFSLGFYAKSAAVEALQAVVIFVIAFAITALLRRREDRIS